MISQCLLGHLEATSIEEVAMTPGAYGCCRKLLPDCGEVRADWMGVLTRPGAGLLDKGG